mmetsp:Transcript_52081/g.83019  ORF Transcript_52081/g.83019 Transcript_52081/m.83019 type:complete len:230 (-) Transcript_52081:12-701(-)|eukprot:CAMPEP_0197056674 /NCGR_PEP_ID=MMETSP1384-20130603/88610_1 /TAXON_ID=29189 /ORGANISM="Ammonia sp." /LENGTH=229 /DNA_ID=CAMNT_0042490771 /DNA_START=71 /DNA_END=760 /DNA_ORIENTATION=-
MAEQKQQDPTNYWLLIAGTTLSKGVRFTDKTRDQGNYLVGITADIKNMEEWVNNDSDSCLQNVVRDMKQLKRATVLARIRECAHECEVEDGEMISIYYTGHGETNTGNWCFEDGVVTLHEVIDAVTSSYPGRPSINLCCDCCFSGNWCIQLSTMKVTTNVEISAASWPGQVAYDTKDGGMFTLDLTEKKDGADMPDLHHCFGGIHPSWKSSSSKSSSSFRMEYYHKGKA